MQDELHTSYRAFGQCRANGNEPPAEATLRIAHAAEYVAAQLGAIARAAEKFESHLAKNAAEDSRPGEESLVYRVL